MGGLTIYASKPAKTVAPNQPSIMSWPHVVTELKDKTELAGRINNVARLISGIEAFRRYNWLKQAPATNIAGNLRGMVISREWRVVFDSTIKIGNAINEAGKVLGPAAIFASFVMNLGQFKRNIDSIAISSDPWNLKAARISTEVSSIMFRTALGGIPSGAHALAVRVEEVARYVDGVTGHQYRALSAVSDNTEMLDQTISSTFDRITDGNTMYTFIQTNLVL